MTAYASLCVFLYVKQRSLLYFPTVAPAEVEAQAFELKSGNLLLKGWAVNPGQPRALIYFGGNGEAVERNVAAFRNALPEVTVYLLPYRSYGGNPGEATEANLYRDALVLYDQIEKSGQADISLMGRSLGSGIASYVASRRQVRKLVLVTPYDSIVNVAQNHYPMFPIRLLLKDRYESWRRAAGIHSDVLVMIAANDEIIPRANTENLIRHFGKKPKVIVFENAWHNDISEDGNYGGAIAEFIGK